VAYVEEAKVHQSLNEQVELAYEALVGASLLAIVRVLCKLKLRNDYREQARSYPCAGIEVGYLCV
jgi:hypothetical protein